MAPLNVSSKGRKARYRDLIRPLISRFIDNPGIKEWSSKYPRFSQFIFTRFSLNEFTGLPLTLIIIIFIANLLLFNELAESIENSVLMLSIDNSVAKYLFSIRTNWVASLIFYFSRAGSVPIVIVASLIAVSILLFQRRFVYLIALIIALSGTGISLLLGKLYFHRIRPDGLSFYQETLYSFPSGHALVAVAFYGLLFYFIVRHNAQHKLRWTMFASLFILLLGFSRLYLCVHYLSDVLAGYSLGFLWLLLAISIIEWKVSKAITGK